MYIRNIIIFRNTCVRMYPVYVSCLQVAWYNFLYSPTSCIVPFPVWCVHFSVLVRLCHLTDSDIFSTCVHTYIHGCYSVYLTDVHTHIFGFSVVVVPHTTHTYVHTLKMLYSTYVCVCAYLYRLCLYTSHASTH